MNMHSPNRIRPTFAVVLVLLLATSLARAGNAAWHVPQVALVTRWAADVGPDHALPEYPRPQMARDTWQNLNGLWDYAVTDKAQERIPSLFDGQILVPFCIESALSGVSKPFLPKDKLWYRRTITIPSDWAGKRLLLHFGAVDWQATVYLDGREVGSHRGGYDAFTIELTHAARKPGPHELIVAVLDPTDTSWQLHGKQTLHPAGCNYTATSGIWQTVWLSRSPSRRASKRCTPRPISRPAYFASP